jgi:hypothetical protein
MKKLFIILIIIPLFIQAQNFVISNPMLNPKIANPILDSGFMVGKSVEKTITFNPRYGQPESYYWDGWKFTKQPVLHFNGNKYYYSQEPIIIQDSMQDRKLYVFTKSNDVNDTAVIQKPKPFWIDYIAVSMIFGYERECYNDSTCEKIHDPFKADIQRGVTPQYSYLCNSYPEDGRCLNPNHYISEWIHQTPTFEGFLKWLHTKTNKK